MSLPQVADGLLASKVRHVHLLLPQWDHLEPSDAEQYGEEPEAMNIKQVSNGHCWTLSRGDPKCMP
jgi:hypothetical protein